MSGIDIPLHRLARMAEIHQGTATRLARAGKIAGAYHEDNRWWIDAEAAEAFVAGYRRGGKVLRESYRRAGRLDEIEALARRMGCVTVKDVAIGVEVTEFVARRDLEALVVDGVLSAEKRKGFGRTLFYVPVEVVA